MCRLFLATCTPMMAALALASAQPVLAEGPPDAASASARDVIAAYHDAYNARDIEAFLATFAQDAVVVVNGTELVGHEAIADAYSFDFAQPGPQSRITRRGRAGRGNIVLEEAFVFADGSEECCTASIVTVEEGRISRLVTERMPTTTLARR